ncbi:NACHT domain-containing protein [Crossiella sp. SN42]|uniref:AfsR/SARP family transcriptional regulator n=1 Tax=Crossiella sp. SN42 TaxID=2944808 RepID=UPI00207D007D|nr:BTAD domain-containing putative transcriptional regulator [Crossiella sp. SN42]MCO1582055.1 NACHT domain-containing protein [Crossiella sp. SN42]
MTIFHILGPVEARDPAGAVLELGARKPVTVLATLLLHPNAWVRVDRLIESTWHEQAVPASAEANLKTYICRLRRLLPSAIESRPGAYRLLVAPGELDADRVADLAAAARTALAEGAPHRAIALYTEALSAWRGRPFEDLPGAEFQSAADRLEEIRRDLRESLAEAQLAAGEARAAISGLRALTADEPLREAAWTQLVRALHAAGRRAEALATYHQARRVLAEELGVDPGPALAEAHQQALATPATSHPRRELPRDIPGFTGRTAELTALAGSTPGQTIVLDGMTGAGKTALAVHAAHRLAARYPDGQFFLDLRAHAEAPPLTPADALARLLRGLGHTAIPADADERAALWRSELSGRRVLLVLDDAADEDQLRPLLPGASASLTLVTTRTRDWRLPGETRYPLNPLSPTESATLFHTATGRPLTSLTTALTACGGNPGALHTVATQLAIRPQWTAADLADWLASAQLAPGLTGSYRRLSAGARSAFHALAALPPEFDARQAGQQLGLSHPDTRRLLEELTDHHLLEAPAPNRFQTHPLVRAHARAARPLSSTRVA